MEKVETIKNYQEKTEKGILDIKYWKKYT